MIGLTGVKMAGAAVLLVLSGYFLYNVGYTASEALHLKAEQDAKEKIKTLEKSLKDTELALSDERAKKQQVKTKIVTRVQREISNLPDRDCGLTADERLRLVDAYCASFPRAPECLSGSGPDPSSAPSAQ